jgi:hypothetical protein
MASFNPPQLPQLPVRKEVLEFLVAAEKLLSPILRDTELTPEECHIISEYLMTMCRAEHPWSSHFKSTVASQAQTTTVKTQPTQAEDGR